MGNCYGFVNGRVGLFLTGSAVDGRIVIALDTLRFGPFAVSTMLVFYALESSRPNSLRSRTGLNRAQCRGAESYRSVLDYGQVCDRRLSWSLLAARRGFGDGAPFVRGKKLTSFSKKEEYDYARDDFPYEFEDALRAPQQQLGATVVVVGRLMTGQNPASAGPMAKELLAALKKLA